MAGDLWSETPEQMKKGFPRCGGKPYGGEGGIRTHGPVISRFTRFRVGAVMTASILLQNLSQHRLSEKGENGWRELLMIPFRGHLANLVKSRLYVDSIPPFGLDFESGCHGRLAHHLKQRTGKHYTMPNLGWQAKKRRFLRRSFRFLLAFVCCIMVS